jgi:sulfatase maturation enzyme AslB (radical SAM superfamily)
LEKPNKDQNLRCKINTGYLCNLNCDFCYFYSRRKTSNYSLNTIKKQLDIAKKFGVESIDFTGGEPTIHKDFLKIIEYARELNFKYICAITNGLTLTYENLKAYQSAGLNDLLFSLHGDGEHHEKVTGIKGSYRAITAAIRNSKELEIMTRINSVVTKRNYKSLPNLSNFMREVKPYNYNIIIYKMQYECGNQEVENYVSHIESSPYIKETIDRCINHIKQINVRYIPFCFMRNYEKHVTNYHQKKYDPFEWSNYLLPKFEQCEDDLLNMCTDFLECGDKNDLNEKAVSSVRMGYTKPEQCLKCRDLYVCDGFEKKYAKLSCISEEAKPISGRKIKDPLYYRK